MEDNEDKMRKIPKIYGICNLHFFLFTDKKTYATHIFSDSSNY